MKAPAAADPRDPPPLAVGQSQLWVWITPALSVAILAVVAWHFRTLDTRQLAAAVPTDPLFWLVFVAYYMSGLLVEFAIFRWLWGIPIEGLVALARKSIGNELLVDYLGEAYFYSWARKKVKMEGSPFGAVKDVAILSALVSNVFTLALMALVYPFASTVDLGFTGSALATSVGLVIIVSLGVAAFGKRIFSLNLKQLWVIAGLHLLRLILSNALLALAWSLALPKVALGWWLILATAKMLLSRLPLISNKDVVFAGFAILLVGHDTEITVLMAVMASLILITHLIVGAALAIGDFVTVAKDPVEKTG